MTARHTVKLTANFERNLEAIEVFLIETEAARAFDALLDELTDIVIPNLERFPGMGRLFLQRLGTQKSPWLIDAEQLAKYLDEIKAKAERDWKRVNG